MGGSRSKNVGHVAFVTAIFTASVYRVGTQRTPRREAILGGPFETLTKRGGTP